MEVAKHMQGAVTVIALDGELDSSTAPTVHQQLGDLVPPHGRVLIDLSRTSYMSSAGLRVLLLVYRQAQANGARLALACAAAGRPRGDGGDRVPRLLRRDRHPRRRDRRARAVTDARTPTQEVR